MDTQDIATEDTALDLARECLYRFLAAALSDPHGEGWGRILEPEPQRLACQAAELVRESAKTDTELLGFGQLPTDQLDLRQIDQVRRQVKRQLELLDAPSSPNT